MTAAPLSICTHANQCAACRVVSRNRCCYRQFCSGCRQLDRHCDCDAINQEETDDD